MSNNTNSPNNQPHKLSEVYHPDLDNVYLGWEDNYRSEKTIAQEINNRFIDNIIDSQEVPTIFQEKIVRQEYINRYPFVKNHNILYDIQCFTEALELIKNDPDTYLDAHELAEYRDFPTEFLRQKGIFYAEGLRTIIKYPPLKGSTVTLNSSFEDKYQIPIRFPNGDVFCFMGYEPNVEFNKYHFPSVNSEVDWYRQSFTMGNLESLSEYPGNKIYVVEGLFDAYRINLHMEAKSIATLGVRGRQQKQNMLLHLKKLGYELIAVPDSDNAGQTSWLNQSDIFSSRLDYNNLSLTNNPTEPTPTTLNSQPPPRFKDIDDKYKYLIRNGYIRL